MWKRERHLGVAEFQKDSFAMDVCKHHSMGRDNLSSGVARTAKAYSSQPNHYGSLKAPGPKLYLNDPWNGTQGTE